MHPRGLDTILPDVFLFLRRSGFSCGKGAAAHAAGSSFVSDMQTDLGRLQLDGDAEITFSLAQ